MFRLCLASGTDLKTFQKVHSCVFEFIIKKIFFKEIYKNVRANVSSIQTGLVLHGEVM